MLNRVLEIIEARRQRGLDFGVGDCGNASQQLQLAEQGERIIVPFQLS